MTASALSARQRQVLDLIRQALATRGYPPSLRELAAALGARQHCSARRHVIALVAKGYLARDAGARSLRVLDPPCAPARP